MKKNIKEIILLCLVAIGYWLVVGVAYAAPNIDPTYRWAWNDVIHWMDFRHAEYPNVEVLSSEWRCYASSSVGYISLNCASGPPGSNCAVDYKVKNNSSGQLSGWAWSEAIGWISFTCDHTADGTAAPNNLNICKTSNYGVSIINGDFTGYAWNEGIG